MNGFKVIVLVILFSSCKMLTRPTFSSEVKGLFFQADIYGTYESNLNYYRTLNSLKETEPELNTIYPPLSSLGTDGRDSSFHNFKFDNNPYAPSELGRGRLTIDKRGYGQQAGANFSIYYLFKSHQNGERAYQLLIDKFKGLAPKSNNSQLQGIKYIEFYDTASSLPGLRISLDYGNELDNGFTLTISLVR